MSSTLTPLSRKESSGFNRRDFIAAAIAGGTGLVVGFYLPHGAKSTSGRTFSPNAYLRITPENKIIIVVTRSEMGQGIRTALPMILAEELEADWKSIEIEQARASTLYGDQTTGGSASVRTTWDPLRKAGAAAREMLISAAALTWGVPRSSCSAQTGTIIHGASKRQLSFGDLVARASTLPIPSEVPLKQGKDYKIVGQRLARIDTPAKVKGEAVFGIDFKLPAMKYALLARSPVIGAKVSGFDDRETRKNTDVKYVGKISDTAIAVVADSVWGAMEGRRVLNVSWDGGPHQELNSASIAASLKQAADKKAVSLFSIGDVNKAAGRKFSAEYQLPFMAHAPMEPGNCTAHFHGTSCELWAPTQVPQDCREAVAQALGFDPDQVKVNVTLMGGGFGRRLEHDYAVESALVSKAAQVPVKVLWTREDDMQSSTYRPASLHHLSATVDAQGFPVAFTHRIIAPSISGQKGLPVPNGIDPDLPDEAAFIYGVPNVSLENVVTETPVPLGWMRSVYALQMAFASESFIDELAVAAHRDPLQYRLHMLAQNKDQEISFLGNTWRIARMRAVLQLAADKAGWSKPLPAGRFRGIACFGCFSSYVAEIVEISMENDEPVVHRVVAAVDCGQVVNPSILEQQIPGGVIYGLSNALRAQITIDKGRVVQSNFDGYEPVRMNEAPLVEVYSVPSAESPTGIGEPSVPPLAPALCNAIYAATKKRIRALPILS